VIKICAVAILASPPRADSPDAGRTNLAPPQRDSALRTAHAARARFQRFAEQDLLPALEAGERNQFAELFRTRPSVLRTSCETQRQRILQTLGGTQASHLLRGSMANLERPGSCWAVEYSGHLDLGLAASLDPETGAILAVWVIPEG
jgi:hypothetical protein